MSYSYYICDVFSDTAFSGNSLAVFPSAQGLTDQQMQSIAREFNFSETTFVFPPKADGDKHLRIFTPSTELPFAGHPNIGTAFVLEAIGAIDPVANSGHIVFEQRAGMVPLTLVRNREQKLDIELKAPQPLSIGEEVPIAMVAAALSIPVEKINTDNHVPRFLSVGAEFLIVELVDTNALKEATVNSLEIEKIKALGTTPFIHIYVKPRGEYNPQARMFAHYDGIPEDPATGSANAALGAFLAQLDARDDADYSWKITQGVEMQRPSVLHVRAEKRRGKVQGVWLKGRCAMFAEGRLAEGASKNNREFD